MDIEDFKSLLKDPQAEESICLGVIRELEISQDKSVLRATVQKWPELIEITARISWSACTSGGGVFLFPNVNDLVLIECANDDEDLYLVTARLSSKDDFIPEIALDGSLVLKAPPEKKSWLSSDTRINLSRGNTEPTENLVIGQVFKTTYISHLNKLIELVEALITQRETDSTHTHITIGIPSTPPQTSAAMVAEKATLEQLKSAIESLLSDDVESENFLSDVAFTEK